MKLKVRDIRNERLIALYLCRELAKQANSKRNFDGVMISNKSLQVVLGVSRVYGDRAIEFAKNLSPIFPYHKLYVDNKNATVLGFGLDEETEPTNYLWPSVPPIHVMEKWLGIDIVELRMHKLKIK